MKTKDLLKEWKEFINESSIIPLKTIKLQIKSNRGDQLKQKDLDAVYERLHKKWNSLYKKYSNVISNDLSSTQEPIEHILSAIESFSIYYNTANSDFKLKIGKGNVTSSELRGYAESKQELKKKESRTKTRTTCRNKGNLTSGTRWSLETPNETSDFDVIYVDDDWTVVYPKTLLGSISWAVGLSDGREEVYELDEKGTQLGRVEWCTASYENNRFPMYASNLHMYYFIKNKGYDINDKFRRLCISIVKHKDDHAAELAGDTDKISIKFSGGATVNAENLARGVGSLGEVIATVGSKKIIDLLKQHTSTKKATSIEEMASKATLPIIKQDELMLSEDQNSLNSQMGVYLKYTKDYNIIDYIITNYKNEQVMLEELLYDDGPLPFKMFTRKDFEEIDNKYNIINRFLEMYKETEWKISYLFQAIIYSNTSDVLIKDKALLDKLFKFTVDFKSYGALQEYILAFTSAQREKVYLTKNIKIRLLQLLPEATPEFTRVFLAEVDLNNITDHSDFVPILKALRKRFFEESRTIGGSSLTIVRLIDAYRDILFNENKALKNYIKLMLS